MLTYNIFPIEPPASPSQLAAYKTLRLASLQIDPQAFLSNYAHEVAFPESIWRERLSSRFKQTFIACAQDVSSAGEQGNVDNMKMGVTGKWMGTATIVGGPDVHPSIRATFKEAGIGTDWEVYALYGMWVHPTHRGKGVGMQLINACFEWARTNSDIKFSRTLEKVVVLIVFEDNVGGQAFYSRTGFTDMEGISVVEGEKWMLARV